MGYNSNYKSLETLEKLILVWESNRHLFSDDQLFRLRNEMEVMRKEILSDIINNSKNEQGDNT